MSYHEKLIELQDQNLFDLPLQNSDIDCNEMPMLEQSGGNQSVHNFENLKNDLLASTEVKIDQKLNEIRDFGIEEFSESTNLMSGGGGEDPQLFDQITLQKEGGSTESSQSNQSISMPKVIDGSVLLEGQEANVEHPPAIQTGGTLENPEGFRIGDLNINQMIEETGNVDNPGEEAQDVDDEHYDEQIEEMKEPQAWFHPELTIESDQEMIVKMNQEDIDSKVNMYLDNYNSEEYQAYLKYFQAIYSASNQKYSIRRDNEGNIYLVKRPPLPKELKGKKVRESISDILNDKDFKSNYLITKINI